jgi:hypothetical protein
LVTPVTDVSLAALVALVVFATLAAFVALDALLALVAFVAFATLVVFIALDAFAALVALVAFATLAAFVALDALLALVAFVAFATLAGFVAFVAFVAFATLAAFVALDAFVAFATLAGFVALDALLALVATVPVFESLLSKRQSEPMRSPRKPISTNTSWTSLCERSSPRLIRTRATMTAVRRMDRACVSSHSTFLENGTCNLDFSLRPFFESFVVMEHLVDSCVSNSSGSRVPRGDQKIIE